MLNTAMVDLADGRIMVYGTMGGKASRRRKAAICTRYARFGTPLQQAITAPLWLLGRTWGTSSSNLKLESRFDPQLVPSLRLTGHDLKEMNGFSDLCGRAGEDSSLPFEEVNRRFHKALRNGAHNPVLEEILDDLEMRSMQWRLVQFRRRADRIAPSQRRSPHRMPMKHKG